MPPDAPRPTPPTGPHASRSNPLTPSRPAENLVDDHLLLALPRDAEGRPVLGRIPLLARLGKGGMGAVYYGVHPRLQVEVAVKVLPHHLAEQDPKLIDRFLSEARMAVALENPHVVRVYDVDCEGRTYFLVMQYVDGESAGAYLRRRREAAGTGLPEREALEVVTAATRGLAAAHERGIIHRDIKPDNILIPKGSLASAKLADLGLAKPEGGGQSLGTMSHVAMGTPGYMAPEQAEDAKTAGPAADVFAMGATLYALLSGQAPFRGSSLVVVLRQTQQQAPEPLPAGVSEPVRRIVDRCLEKDPARRYPNASALLADLDAAATGAPVLPTLISAPPPPRAPTRSYLGPLLVTVVLLLAIGGGIAALRYGGTAPPPVPTTASPPPVAKGDSLGPYLAAADALRLMAEAKDTPAEWDRVLEALGKASPHAESAADRERVAALDRSARRRKGWALAREADGRGDLEGALSEARKAAELAPAPAELDSFVTDLEARKKAADERAARKREFDEWAARARAEKDPTTALAYWGRAKEVADAAADVEEVRVKLERLAAELANADSGRRFAALLEAARSAVATRDLDRAEASIRQALALKPADAEALSLLRQLALTHVADALEHQKNQRAREAASAYAAAVRVSPNSAEVRLRIARGRRELRDERGAIEAFDEAVRLDPRDAQVFVERGRLRMALRHLDGAREDFDKALELRPDLVDAMIERSVIRRSLGDLSGALEDLNRAVAAAPERAKAWTYRADSRRDLGDIAGALSDVDHALTLDPKSDDAHLVRAMCRMAVGDHRGAVADFEAVVRLNPAREKDLKGHLEAARRRLAELEEPLGGKIPWRMADQLDAALKEAAEKGRPVVLYFTAKGSAPDRALDRGAFSDPEVVRAAGECITVRVEGDQAPELKQRYGITGVPTVLFLGPDGKAVGRLDSREPAEVKRQLEDLVNTHGRPKEARLTPYESWARFKPGSWMKYRNVVKTAGGGFEQENTQRLKEVTREKVVIEVTSFMKGMPETKPTLVEFPNKPMEPPKEGVGVKTTPLPAEDLTIGTRVVRCEVQTIDIGDSTSRSRTKVWRNPSFPGPVRLDLKAEKPTPMESTMVLVDWGLE